MKRLKTVRKHLLHHRKSRIRSDLKNPWQQDQNGKNSAQTAKSPSLFCTAAEVRLVGVGDLGAKPVSRRLSWDLVATTNTAAPGRRAGDQRKNYDKANIYGDEIPNSVISTVNLGPLSSL